MVKKIKTYHWKSMKNRPDQIEVTEETIVPSKSPSRIMMEKTLKYRYKDYLSTLFDDEVKELADGVELILYVHK